MAVVTNLKKNLKIHVIGSSAASNFANLPDDVSWPNLLKRDLGETAEVSVTIRGAMTPVRCIEELLNVGECDLLILHLGTSVGWPVPLAALNQRLGIDFEAEHGLHQPAFRSKNFKRRVSGFLKAKVRNFVKYVLFFTGCYKPRVNVSELKEQVHAVLTLAHQKAPRVIWIQHRALHNRRIILERAVYSRFYKRIIEAVREQESQDLTLITEDGSFLVPENYLLDYVHLSERGHREIFNRVRQII